MDDQIYKQERSKIRHLILSGATKIEIVLASEYTKPFLSESQKYDYEQLIASQEAIDIKKRLEFSEKFEFNFKDIAGIQYIIEIFRLYLDFKNYKAKVNSGVVYEIMNEYYYEIKRVGKKIMGDITIVNDQLMFKLFTEVISKVLGAYVGECLISSCDEGRWYLEGIKEYPSQMSSMIFKNKKSDKHFVLNPAGKVMKNLYYGQEDDVLIWAQANMTYLQNMDKYFNF